MAVKKNQSTSARNQRAPASAATSVSIVSDTGTNGTVKGIRVRSFPETFRRAGIEFTSKGIDLRLDRLTEEQLEAIVAEPMLSVSGVYLPDDNGGRNAVDENDDSATDGANGEKPLVNADVANMNEEGKA